MRTFRPCAKLRLMVERPILLSRARAMRREPTAAERALWRMLRSRGFEGLKFRRQVPIGRYIADFTCFDPKLVIECDGGQHAESGYDAARNAWFERQGFRVLRFWNDAAVREPETVRATILAAVSRSRDPSPSHASDEVRAPSSRAQGEEL